MASPFILDGYAHGFYYGERVLPLKPHYSYYNAMAGYEDGLKKRNSQNPQVCNEGKAANNEE